MKPRVALPLLLAASFLSAPAKPPMDWASLMLIKAAAEKGDTQAQFLYGMQVSVGDGITADPVEAAKWFRQAALSGQVEAQYALGMLYADTAGKMFDPVSAEIWLEKAAQQGDARAVTQLGVLLARGAGRDRSALREPANPSEQPGPTKNDAADRNAAKSIPAGESTVRAAGDSRKMDEAPETTVRWSLILSALRGADAYVVRGYLLENGVGMMRDDVAAADAYRHAAGLGSALAQFHLGQLYAEGRGVSRDLAEACYWLRLAAGGGSTEAGVALAALLPRLDKGQLAVADRLARERTTLAEKK